VHNRYLPPQTIYGSDPSKRKGKEKALKPFPLGSVEVTNSEDDEHLEVDEILAESDSGEQSEHPTYVSMLLILFHVTERCLAL
jgi:hypothetical protein